MTVKLLREPSIGKRPPAATRGAGTTAVLGYVEAVNPEMLDALCAAAFAWEGLILPVREPSSPHAVGLSFDQLPAVLRHWPKALPWFAAPVDAETWVACERFEPHGYYLNGDMSKASQWGKTRVPTGRPYFITTTLLTEDDISAMANLVLPVRSLVVERSAAPVVSAESIMQMYRFRRWGWPLSYLCDVEHTGDAVLALCLGVSSVVLRIRASSEQATSTQFLSSVRRGVDQVNHAPRLSHHPFIPATPEELDRAERNRPTLVAGRFLRPRDLLTASAVKSEQGTEGISADLAARLKGCSVQYELKAGDPLTFGHIEWRSGAAMPALNRTPIRVSVVIRSKNEARWLGGSVRAIQSQSGVGQVEIIVVDNDSTDDTVRIAQGLGCVVSSISDQEFTYGRALNCGIEMAQGEFVAIASAHCIPVNDRWLLRLLANFHVPAVVGVYGRQIPLPDSNDFDKRDLWITFGLDRKVQRKDSFFHNANCMIRKSAWQRVKFDETLHGVEDRAWAQRVLKTGYCVFYEPFAPVYHYHGIHQGRDEQRAQRVVKVIELIHRAL